mmetsp:Transcript_20786/g.63963  ORF Transcript_20786/g.63963 Transcript_20786/m.63963 type:complete len:138 (+) Transcript_20786:3-416(+)
MSSDVVQFLRAAPKVLLLCVLCVLVVHLLVSYAISAAVESPDAVIQHTGVLLYFAWTLSVLVAVTRELKLNGASDNAVPRFGVFGKRITAHFNGPALVLAMDRWFGYGRRMRIQAQKKLRGRRPCAYSRSYDCWCSQ